MLSKKLHDPEFSPGILSMLRHRDILSRANSVNGVPLVYAIDTRLVEIENAFQTERKENPLLEQTRPEAWLAAILVDEIRTIRSNVEISDRVLSEAVQVYLRRRSPAMQILQDDGEGRLLTTVSPFLLAVGSLLKDCFERRKSVFGILGLRANSGSLRQIVRAQPKSEREKLIVRSINERWSNHKLARELTDANLKPKDPRWKTYVEFQHQEPQQFSVLKSAVKKKYLASPAI